MPWKNSLCDVTYRVDSYTYLKYLTLKENANFSKLATPRIVLIRELKELSTELIMGMQHEKKILWNPEVWSLSWISLICKICCKHLCLIALYSFLAKIEANLITFLTLWLPCQSFLTDCVLQFFVWCISGLLQYLRAKKWVSLFIFY